MLGHDLSPAERRKVTEAITRAERATDGEIVVVAARASDDYIHVPVHIAAGVALAVPLFVPLLARLAPWSAISIHWLFVVQLCVFIAVALLLSLPALRHAVTPRKLMHKYAHRNAAAQFLATNIAATRARTGILIFVSLLERYVEVIGDKAIADKLSQADWQKIIDDMVPLLREKKATDALVLGVDRCGALLARHFPASKDNPNELPDHFIVLE
ncbi:MAG: TPM domain-containing protein [Alphaproteobacteria bacterium]|nr:TPM domain-containing protein [Alphaproteobacteria bacterium]